MGLYFPALQSLHADAPSVALKVPSPQSRHDDAFVAQRFSLALPFSHMEQAEAEAADHVPALQSPHTEAAFVSEKWPAPQAVHSDAEAAA